MSRAVRLGLAAVLCGAVVWAVGREGKPPARGWAEVVPGVLRSAGSPAGYALVQGERVLLIDAPHPPEGLRGKVEVVLLTHGHRDTLAALGEYQKRKATIRAPKTAKPVLDPDAVKRYWQEALPLRNSRTAYLVVPEGVTGIEYGLDDGETVTFGDWTLRAVATPGHTPEQTCFVAQKAGGKKLLFAGDAVTGDGKLWSPYTTDWDHWTDAGLKPTAESLRKLAALRADVLLPAHGEVRTADVERLLTDAAKRVEEVAFLKSYERYTRDRLKNPPKYAFLAKEQAGSGGQLAWSRLSKSLWFTGNTYVLRSKDGPCLVVDPWDPHSAKQIPKLQKDEGLGRVEVVLCSHAHFDHYDGAYVLFERDKPELWTLDVVARPIAEPFLWRAPFLDARPVKVAKTPGDGETLRWREYALKFHHLPGQTVYTTGVETTIDGKRCLFTGDNFFHHDLYSGTGGWMGLNRSGPVLYERGARKVLEVAPEWVLAEHGSAMEFNADDFKRRVAWAQESGKAADALCVTSDHRHDWNPHHVRVEPVLRKVKAGEAVTVQLVVENVLATKRKLRVRLADQTWDFEVEAGKTVRRPVMLPVGKLPAGRHVFALEVREGDAVEPGDAFAVVEVEGR